MAAKKALLVVCVLAVVAPAVADAQSWVLRARAIAIEPDDSSSEVGDTGSYLTVDGQYTIEVDITRKFNHFLGLELIAATAEHDIDVERGALAGASAGSVKVLPPTLTLQWFILGEGFFSPYVGAGVNFTKFYSYDLSSDLAGLGVTDVDFDDSWGFAANAGFDINLSRLILNFDVKYIDISTDAAIRVDGGTLDTVSVDVNPWVIGAGVGFRFGS